MIKSPPQSRAHAAGKETVEQRLRQLESQWLLETEFLSDAGKIVDHPAFKAIIALGDAVVPLLLKDLEAKPSLLVWALPEITGENPVSEDEGGNIRKMTDAWIKWARAKGLR